MELDLQEQARRDDNYEVLNRLIDDLNQLSVFPSLVWLWTWDIVKDNLDTYTPDSGEYYIVNPNINEKQVFDLFWEDADKNQFSLTYGDESVHEAIFDWMRDRDILVDADDEGEE